MVTLNKSKTNFFLRITTKIKIIAKKRPQSRSTERGQDEKTMHDTADKQNETELKIEFIKWKH